MLLKASVMVYSVIPVQVLSNDKFFAHITKCNALNVEKKKEGKEEENEEEENDDEEGENEKTRKRQIENVRWQKRKCSKRESEPMDCHIAHNDCH